MFSAFASTVEEAQDRIVVLDTAPTGHTLLLLDAAEGYQREIERTNARFPTPYEPSRSAYETRIMRR